ncbi:nitrous oxide reductase accessory protein NosL [Arcobacter arenosus]|uniref:nitrous oxide reductase accessory protein NosL n=1 Tax=Arcobacter arenosus TaxID=2576037 RepID=UPI003BA916F6
MIDFVKRDNNDIFKNSILGFLFKNKKFLLALRIAVTALFFYAIYYGFVNPGRDNIFTGAVFWGIFWALFMVVTLSTFGRIFCGICPHGFLGKYITKFGLKKTMPKWMQNRYIGILILVIGWWGVYYTFDGFWKSPFNTALMFSVLTLLSFIIYYIYKDMSYCKYICPIGTLTRAYDKLSFTKLETYTQHCKDCKTFECASACEYNLKPFTFAKKNQTDDCTLCMDCATSCEAVSFKFTKPAEQLNKKLKILNAEIWTYILILASIPVSMGFAHGLNRSNIAEEFIWNKTAAFFDLTQYAGGFAFLYAVIFTVFFSFLGLFLASKVLKKEFNQIFTTLGIAFIPLFIFASLGHTLEMFFIKDYVKIVEGFAQAFGMSVDVVPLAKRGDAWLHYFKLFKWIGVIWAFIILYKRIKLIDSTKVRKLFGFFFASFAILFYIGLNIYTGYIFSKYGAKARGGHSHGGNASGKMFQTVSFKDATLIQEGKDKTSGVVCGMNLPMFYKTNHSATLDGKPRQYCSIHCLTEDLKIKKLSLKNIKVVDVTTLKFIDAKSAFYVVGSRQKGTMSMVSKYAFANKKDAFVFSKKYGGEVVDFQKAMEKAMEDFKPKKSWGKKASINPKQEFYLSLTDPTAKKKSYGGHMHGGGGKPSSKKVIPTKKLYLAYENRGKKSIYPTKNISFYVFDKNQNQKDIIEENSRGKKVYKFETPSNGYYNIFAIEQTKVDEKSYYKVAKLEHLQGKHGSDDIYTKDIKKELNQNVSKIDLIRIKSEDEDSFFYRLSMGDTLSFKALFNGKPLKDATLKIKLQSGWVKRFKTDENGLVNITLIRDYFPKWEDFDKRYKQELMLTLEYEVENEKYILTYPAFYYPNKSDYESYSYGLIILLITSLIGGFIVYRFRKNRTKAFAETRYVN